MEKGNKKQRELMGNFKLENFFISKFFLRGDKKKSDEIIQQKKKSSGES